MAKKILVIDDDDTDLVLIESRLRKVGYDVAKALNGTIGLAAAKNAPPDLIILDVEMPEMNGYTFIFEMKKLDALKDIPVIVLTSHEENKPIFKRRGVEHYLVKPVNFDMLFSMMDRLLGQMPGKN